MQTQWKRARKITKKVDTQLREYPPLIRQLLFNRGIVTQKAAQAFFVPSKAPLHDPALLYDVKKAARVILKLVKEKKKIFIHGDFDVDGICSTAILWDFLYRKLQAQALPYVPSRFDEGYGMTESSLSNIAKEGGEVVITVDCGIKDHDLVKRWKEKGMEFVITDHHELKKKGKKPILPDKALAVVHPQHPKGAYPFKDISGATVVWKLVTMLAQMAGVNCDTDEYIDLVTLSTVCDVMPLIDENRSLVTIGLKKLANTKWIGLRRLMHDAGIKLEEVEAYHVGFIIGPRLNAAGRLDHAIDAIRLLVTKSLSQAREISQRLNQLNQERQHIQEIIHKHALQQIEEIGFERKLYFVWGEEWAEGVIGIVAGKISETYHRPVLIATRKGERYTGSARSPEQFNIIQAIRSQADLLERFGGHPQAAGFTVGAEHIELFRDNLLEIADQELGSEDMQKEYSVDSVIKIEAITWELLEWIEKFAPFGFGNPRPTFVLKGVKLHDIGRVGNDGKHMKLSLYDQKEGRYVRGIGFGLGEKCDKLNSADVVDMLFTIERNIWNGNEYLQLKLRDVLINE